MSKYIFMQAGVVAQIIHEEDPIFPGIPIHARYAPDFLAECDAVDEKAVVEIGFVKTEAGYEPAPPPPPMPIEPGFPVDPPAPEPTWAERVEALEAAMLATMMGGV